jgi:hypothetical protein
LLGQEVAQVPVSTPAPQAIFIATDQTGGFVSLNGGKPTRGTTIK